MIVIAANGEFEHGEWAQVLLARARVLIAADGGLRHLMVLGRVPDIWVGDGDSSMIDVVQKLQPPPRVERHPTDKDDIDLALALSVACGLHPSWPIRIIGAFGGRVDMTLANLLILADPRWVSRDISLVDGRQAANWVTGSASWQGEAGDTLSLLPLAGDVHVQATSGLRWPLADETLKFGESRGVSNEFSAETAAIILQSGSLAAIHTKQASLT